MKFRKNYQYDPSHGLVFTHPSMTQQHFKDECDVNQILRKYQQTGLITHLNNTPGTYGDVSEYDASDYQRAMQIVIDAQARFDDLPSSIRKRFNNDPQEFLAFVSSESNRDEAVALGLIEKPDSPAVSISVEKPDSPADNSPTN